MLVLFVFLDAGPSVDHIGSKSNELFHLKQGSHVDLYYGKIKELPSNSLDVSQGAITYFCLSLYPSLLCLLLIIDN